MAGGVDSLEATGEASTMQKHLLEIQQKQD
jgi:hypothetical protein